MNNLDLPRAIGLCVNLENKNHGKRNWGTSTTHLPGKKKVLYQITDIRSCVGTLWHGLTSDYKRKRHRFHSTIGMIGTSLDCLWLCSLGTACRGSVFMALKCEKHAFMPFVCSSHSFGYLCLIKLVQDKFLELKLTLALDITTHLSGSCSSSAMISVCVIRHQFLL